MLHIQIVLFDGFDLLDAIGPYEVFCAAGMFAGEGKVTVELVSAEGAREVPSGMNGPAIAATHWLDPYRPGIIVVPGASGHLQGEGVQTVPMLLAKATETPLAGLLKQAMEQKDTTIATVCGGSILLAMEGLLDGRYAVTNHLGMEVLQAAGAIPVQARVVEDGRLVTGGGVTSGLDVALYLVERELGPQISHAVEQLFEYERRGTVWRSSGITPVVGNREDEIGNGDDADHEPASRHGNVAAFEGTWDILITTPIGKLSVQLEITSEQGQISGVARQGNDIVRFKDPAILDDRLTWSQQVTKPMRLNLKFDVAVAGDQMSGVAKAGKLPASKLTGVRVQHEQGR
ncbi:DJ-1/PfpI family protein [Paenibacillus sp. JCM 10914]|uniref:DJ-1/PfpI family protein n=1 Tax=Paenibacillus sp. JCM 10914 TaxID=1236974 RepID=UPI0005655705|nr:DJ-1/PfpI family protein [Paenibacillus sp. JCM 10914]